MTAARTAVENRHTLARSNRDETESACRGDLSRRHIQMLDCADRAERHGLFPEEPRACPLPNKPLPN